MSRRPMPAAVAERLGSDLAFGPGRGPCGRSRVRQPSASIAAWTLTCGHAHGWDNT